MVEKEVRYVRIMPPVTDPSSALGKSWRHSLRVESEAEAEAKLAELESTWTWLPGGMLRTVTKPMPAVLREERTGREVFFTAAESTLNSIVDEVNVPETTGDFVLQWRWDAEQTAQVWNTCADVTVV